MNPPNAGDNSTQYYSISTPESGEDKAAQTRRKNAEAQKLYRERKKAHEAGLVNQGNDVLLLEACLHRSDLD